MFNFSLIYDPDPQKYLDYHKDLLKKAEQERLIREVMQATEINPKPSRSLDWLRHLFLRPRKQVKLAKQASRASQVHS